MHFLSTERNQDSILLVAAFLLCYFHYTFFHGGYLGYDELEYARLATLLLDGRFEHDSLYAFRYMGFVPLTIVYFFTGPGDLANWLVPTITLLLISWIVLRILRQRPFSVKILAVLLLITSPLHLLYLEKPMPDFTTELGVLLCFYSYYKRRWRTMESSEDADVALFLLGFVTVFLSKESFLIVYPVFLLFFVMDLKNRNRVTYWMKVFAFTVIFLLLYLTCNAFMLGNPLARIDALFSNRYISECTYELQPVGVILKRIGYELWLNLTRMGVLIPLSMAIVLSRGKAGLWKDETGFWIKSWFILLLLSNFMTISYTTYVPLCPDPRHFLFLLPVGVIVFVLGLEKIRMYANTDIFITLGMYGIQWLVSWYFKYENHHFLFGFILAGLILWWKWNYWKTGSLIIAAALFSVFIQNARYNQRINHAGQKALIQNVLSVNSNPKWILTDGANSNIGRFYARYSEKYQFVVFHEFDEKKHKDREIYCILNGMTAYLSNTNWDKVPEFVKTADGKLPPIFENQSGKVYRVR